MTTIPGAFGGGSDLARLKAVLADWRTSLVDLSGRNRLLNFKHTRTSTLELSAPSPSELVRLLEGRALRFAPLPDEVPAVDEEQECPPPGEDDVVTQKTTAPALQRALRSLRSKATQVFNDYGLWTLHLGVGMLHWREDGATVGSRAPLILFPVEIVRGAYRTGSPPGERGRGPAAQSRPAHQAGAVRHRLGARRGDRLP
ncbi:DUF4011 domain-containing protein [Streptomyces sp. NPDC093250]|uniref:DUF4011 domain-containing protein n=1 Tax=Streptomyces sp. NPDC093250 TaxID=3366036 RepID=UPI0038022D67